jgi:V/A-type H+-transporting ATPase subunit I
MAYAVGYQMIYIGVSAAVLLALIQKRLKGLTEIMNVISIFADTLSYLRLYALALASTVMAETFNELGFEVGLAVGSLIILGGHSVNLLLGSMSGVIHGLRLNFLEWYHYSFQGGGRLFAPLHRFKKQ